MFSIWFDEQRSFLRMSVFAPNHMREVVWKTDMNKVVHRQRVKKSVLPWLSLVPTRRRSNTLFHLFEVRENVPFLLKLTCPLANSVSYDRM